MDCTFNTELGNFFDRMADCCFSADVANEDFFDEEK